MLLKKEAYTIGKLYIDNKYFCDTLEDRDRGLKQSMPLSEILKIKVKHQTAIPGMTHVTDTLHHIGNVVNNITNGSVLGNMLVGACATIAGFLAPIKYLLLICFAMTVMDMIQGIRVAKRFKKKIESGKNWKGTIRKIIDEFTIIALTHGVEWAILDESGVFVLTGGVTAIITLTELWSIIENLNTLDPKGPWKLLGKFLKKKGEDFTGIDLDDDENIDDTNVAELPSEDRR